jgi:hypothetical protein
MEVARLLPPTRLHRVTAALGGLAVSVLGTGPKVRGFKSGRGQSICHGDKKSAARLPSERK